MAKLRDETVPGAPMELEIVPVTPTLDGPYDAYDITVWKAGQKVFYHQYNVSGWQLGHYYMFRIARAFQHATALVEAKTPFTLRRFADDDDEYDSNEGVCLRVDIIWLEVVLWGDRIDDKARFFVNFRLWENPDEDYASNARLSTPLIAWKGNRIRCHPENAVKFGNELESECHRAEQTRVQLGIANLDDYED